MGVRGSVSQSGHVVHASRRRYGTLAMRRCMSWRLCLFVNRKSLAVVTGFSTRTTTTTTTQKMPCSRSPAHCPASLARSLLGVGDHRFGSGSLRQIPRAHSALNPPWPTWPTRMYGTTSDENTNSPWALSALKACRVTATASYSAFTWIFQAPSSSCRFKDGAAAGYRHIAIDQM